MKYQTLVSFVLILGSVAAFSTSEPERSAPVKRHGPGAENSLEQGKLGDLVSCAVTAATKIISCFKKLSIMDLEHSTSSGQDSVGFPTTCIFSALMDFIKCISTQNGIEHQNYEYYDRAL